jgi:hypothetical protein
VVQWVNHTRTSKPLRGRRKVTSAASTPLPAWVFRSTLIDADPHPGMRAESSELCMACSIASMLGRLV